MPDVDFAMSYPCFFLLTERGNPESVISDGDHCICLFTDRDNGEKFYKGHYGDNFVTRTVEVIEMPNRLRLLARLRELEPQLAVQNVCHVAIDPTPGKFIARVTFAELMGHLDKQTD